MVMFEFRMPGIPPQNSPPTGGGSTRAFCSAAALHVAPDAFFRSMLPHLEFFDAIVSLPS